MACEDCGVDPTKNPEISIAMVPMVPGRDGKPWEFCLRCFMEGRTPQKVGNFKEPTVITDEKLYDALVSASSRTPGLNPVNDRPRGQDDPKRGVANFDQVPPRKKRKAS